MEKGNRAQTGRPSEFSCGGTWRLEKQHKNTMGNLSGRVKARPGLSRSRPNTLWLGTGLKGTKGAGSEEVCKCRG